MGRTAARLVRGRGRGFAGRREAHFSLKYTPAHLPAQAPLPVFQLGPYVLGCLHEEAPRFAGRELNLQLKPTEPLDVVRRGTCLFMYKARANALALALPAW